ncbi:hypothetical protein LCGC14_0387850 [marine sediment metagenome]|uniref:Uncharacterized protein n=1 Tax=marine sediment metagenome TaxID=412755 RepID=A0A0F9W9G8_9ZZZZ
MALTEEQEQEMWDKVNRLHDHIVGYDGVRGLSEKVAESVEKNDDDHEDMRINHSRLSKRFYMLVAFLVGSGILGGSIAGAMLGGG